MEDSNRNFKPLSLAELTKILGLTIKQDETNKLITFLCQLSAFSADSQFNLSFNAPSSTGKSYIPLEISQLFPEDDLIKLGHVSTTSFFHDVDKKTYDEEKNRYTVSLSRKVIIFIDQPHIQFMERFRPLLSHDAKEIESRITDKNQSRGLHAKKVLIIGFPSVIFCTAGLTVDEQESTRFLLLSPEINQEKIRESIYEKVRKESDREKYSVTLEMNSERTLLKERIKAIRDEHIEDIKISSSQLIIDRFMDKHKFLRPRHQRDIGRIMSLAKALALLNLWWRDRNSSTITANDEDIAIAFKIWDGISESQELNLPQFVFDFYKDIIVPGWAEKHAERNVEHDSGVDLPLTGSGLLHEEILAKYFEVYSMQMSFWQLRKEVLPLLETAGLIRQEQNPVDRRSKLVLPARSDIPKKTIREEKEAEGNA